MNYFDLDKRDEEIIDILANDARISNREVARTMGLSEAAIRKRIKRLEDSRAARVVAVVDASVMGFSFSCMLRIMAAPGKARSIAVALADMDNVSFVALTTGPWAVTVTINAVDRNAHSDFIHEVVDALPGVLETEIINIVSIAKNRTDIVYIP